MKDIVIVGAGGFGREVLWLIEQINKNTLEWNFLGFIDDGKDIHEKINGYPVLGKMDWLLDKSIYVVFAIGDPLVKKSLVEKLKNTGNKYPVLIHPSINMSKTNQIEEGTIICEGSILTVNIRIGKHVIINLDTTMGHDVVIEDYCTILPSVNVSGNVHLKENVMIGTGSQIIQNIEVGHNSIIGAGSVVNKSIDANVVAVGVPARVIKTR